MTAQLQAKPHQRRQQLLADSNDTTTSAGNATCNAFTMLLLDYQNVLIQSVLTERFSG